MVAIQFINKPMFGIFKKKSQVEKLEEKHRKLLEEAFKLASINRKQSDAKTAEANKLLDEIERLKNQSNN